MFILWMALPAIVPAPAFAYDFTPPARPFEMCPDIPGFTTRVIGCIKGSVLAATNTFLGPFFSYAFGILAACLTMAVALWGALMMTGHRAAPMRDAFTLAVKAGVLIMLFTGTAYNFQYFFGAVLDGMEGLLDLVTGYVDFSPTFIAGCEEHGGWTPEGSQRVLLIWARVDCVLDSLIGGVLPQSAVAGGIAGFFLAALVSNAAGIFVGFLGFFLIIDLLLAIIRAVYIFIMAYMAIAVMAIIAPIFLPMTLFRVTRGYFEKWLKLTLGFILQPIFLFVYLAMLLAAYEVVVYSGPFSLYRTLSGKCNMETDCVDFPYFQVGYWASGSGVYAEGSTGKRSINVNTRHSTPQGVKDIQTGVVGKIGEAATQPANWDKKMWKDMGHSDIYDALGISKFFFSVDLPTPVVDWEWLAVWNDYYPPRRTCSVQQEQEDGLCTTDYLINLFLSLIMAVAVAYIFRLILDFMPYIGVGLTGDVLASPTFGVDRLAPPGEKMINSFRGGMGGG